MALKKKHPKGLYVLFSTEMWERFNFYGMRAIMTLYMVYALNFSESEAAKSYGAYLGLGYLATMLGGYLADKYWGNRKCIYVGSVLMFAAQMLLFVSASVFSYDMFSAKIIFLVALVALVLGTGIFKPNISTIVGDLYGKKDDRLDNAYTIFYMGINLGSLLGMFICSQLGDSVVKDAAGNITRDLSAFKWGFLAAAVAMLLGMLSFYLYRRFLLTPEGAPLGLKPKKQGVHPLTAEQKGRGFNIKYTILLVGLLTAAYFLWHKDASVANYFGLSFWALLYGWVYGLGLMLLGRIVVDRSFRSVSEASFRGWWILELTFLLTLFFNYLLSDGVSYNLSVNLVYALIYALGISLILNVLIDRSLSAVERGKVGVLIVSAFFVIFFWAAFEQAGSSLTFVANNQTDTNIGTYTIPPSQIQMFNGLFVILFAPVMVLIWQRLSRYNSDPNSFTKQAIGLLFLSLGYLIIAFVVKDIGLSEKISFLWLALMYWMHTIGELCLSPIGLSLVYKLAPKRMVGLLLGIWFVASSAGYALAGTLGALLPQNPAQFKKAAEQGIDLAGILEGRIIATESDKAVLKLHNIMAEYPQIMGIKIESLYDFFMVFVCLCSVAGGILLIIAPKLNRIAGKE